MSDKPKCAWCKIDVNKHIKVTSDEMPEESGYCPTCGKYYDRGQKSITIHNMKQIYDGCISVVNEFVSILEECMNEAEQTGEDLAYFLGCDTNEQGGVEFRIHNADIVRWLFLQRTMNAGGTSTRHLMDLLGVEDDYVAWNIGGRMDDETD